MSKSMARVRRTLEEAGITPDIHETDGARTAQEAADAVGCDLDQIAKSIIFQGHDSGQCLLFLTAGGNQVDGAKAGALAGEALDRADAAAVRAQTGFAIGGVSPVGHLNPIRAWADPRLMTFDVIWAAAGTPRHVFPLSPDDLIRLSGAKLADFSG